MLRALVASVSLVAVAAVLGGCNKGEDAPSCKDAADKAAKAMPGLSTSDAEALATTCDKEHWAASARSCVASATDKAGLLACVAAATPAVVPALSGAKSTLAATQARRYALEAYPQWAMSHPDKACPAGLTDLAQYVNGAGGQDPWGHPYRMVCGPDAPPKAHGFGVASAGPDGTPDTGDDIHSWDSR